MNRVVNGILSWLLALLFLGAGILCLVLGIGRLRNIMAGKFVETQATITQIDSHVESDPDGPDRTVYDLTVEYEVDGKRVVSRLDENPREFHDGMELTVAYNVDKPTEVTLPGREGSYIMIFMGTVGVLCGLFLIVEKLRGH